MEFTRQKIILGLFLILYALVSKSIHSHLHSFKFNLGKNYFRKVKGTFTESYYVPCHYILGTYFLPTTYLCVRQSLPACRWECRESDTPTQEHKPCTWQNQNLNVVLAFKKFIVYSRAKCARDTFYINAMYDEINVQIMTMSILRFYTCKEIINYSQDIVLTKAGK